MARAASKRKSIYHDLIYKLVAVGLAVILWFFSISNSQFEANAEFPIEIRNIQEGKTLSQEAPQTATIRFKGTGRALAKLYLFLPFSKSKLVLDLVMVRQRYTFYLDEYLRRNPQRISIPIPGIRESLEFVEVVQPDSIQIVLSDYKEKWVLVRPQITIDIAPGYTQVGEIVVTPPQVLVRGAAEAVNQVNEVLTSRRTYRMVAEPLEITVGLWHPAPGRILAIEPLNVTLSVDVQMIGERRLTDVPVKVMNVPGNLSVLVGPSSVALTVTGGVDYLANLDDEAVEVFIDYQSQWSPTNLMVEPQVRLGPNLLEYRDLVPKQLEIITTRPTP
ncbi:MAG: YbbR-like domain-containing protein [Candidatus Neomarinimicrobiota bacterium]